MSKVTIKEGPTAPRNTRVSMRDIPDGTFFRTTDYDDLWYKAQGTVVNLSCGKCSIAVTNGSWEGVQFVDVAITYTPCS